MHARFASAFALVVTMGCAPEVAPGPGAPPDPPTAAAPSPAPAEEQPVEVAPKLNEKYEAQADPKVWEGRFEREGREAHDRKAEILAALDIKPGMTVADVGAGTGLFTLDLSSRVGDEGKVYAVDVQDYFLDHIQAKLDKAKIENTETLRASQRSSNLPPDSVDVIFLSNVYHHIEYPKSYLASMRAALRDGGRLAIVEYKAIPGESAKWLLEHIRATPAEFRAEIEAAGFTLSSSHEFLEENFFYVFAR